MAKGKQRKRGLVVKRATRGAGFGLFTTKPIEKDDFIIEYTGKKILNSVADELETRYIFEINSRYSIDGSPRSNLARYINHSCKPNSEPEIDRGHIYIYAFRNIKEGEELTYDYGKEYFDEFLKGKCRCGFCDGSGKKTKGSQK